MDWKVRATNSRFEKAKDVAAFANHVGGVLIIGAQETKGQLSAYVPMTPPDAAKVRDEFSKSIAERCQPLPHIDFEEYEESTGRVVVVNVWPSLSLVGTWAHADSTKDSWGGHAYVYAVRTGTDTEFLEPSQLPMYMTPQVRRIAVLLSRIEQGAKVRFLEFLPNQGKGDQTYIFDGIFEEENLVKFAVRSGDTQSALHVPLDRILSVYQASNQLWHIIAEFYR